MIENGNDLISLLLVIFICLYLVYKVIMQLSYRNIAKNIREEQRYYKEWLDNQEIKLLEEKKEN